MPRNRNFILLWLTTATSTLALELFYVTVLVTIFQQTESTLLAALTMVARTLPAFVLGPLAGVLVDRFPRKLFIIAMDVVRFLFIALAVLMLQDESAISIVGIYIIVVGLSSAGVFHRPARLSIIPTIVSKTQLVKANSWILVSTQIVLAIAYIVGGVLIVLLPLSIITIGIGLLFMISIILVIPITTHKQKSKQQDMRESVRKSFVSGLQYMWKHPVARPLTVMETIESLPNGIWTGALMLAFTLQGLGGTTADWGLQTSSYFIGMIVGSIASMMLTRQLEKFPGWIIIANAFIAGILTLLYANSPSVAFAVVLALMFGPPFALRDVAQDSLLQATVDNEQLGRVYATREMLRNITFMFAGIFFAWLSELIPIRFIYGIGGVIYLITAVYALSNRALRQSRMMEQVVESA